MPMATNTVMQSIIAEVQRQTPVPSRVVQYHHRPHHRPSTPSATSHGRWIAAWPICSAGCRWPIRPVYCKHTLQPCPTSGFVRTRTRQSATVGHAAAREAPSSTTLAVGPVTTTMSPLSPRCVLLVCGSFLLFSVFGWDPLSGAFCLLPLLFGIYPEDEASSAGGRKHAKTSWTIAVSLVLRHGSHLECDCG